MQSPIHYVDPKMFKYVGDDDVSTYLNDVVERDNIKYQRHSCQ